MIDANFLNELCDVIAQRVREKPKGSYVSGLATKGLASIRAKITEESGELVEASEQLGRQKKTGVPPKEGTTATFSRNDIIWEAADLLFHMLVLLEVHGIPFNDVLTELKGRRK